MTIKFWDNHDFKDRLLTTEHLNLYLKSSDNLWNETSKRQKVEVNDAWAKNNCAVHPQLSVATTSSTLPSRIALGAKNLKPKRFDKFSKVFTKEMIDAAIPHLIVPYTYSCFVFCSFLQICLHLRYISPTGVTKMTQISGILMLNLGPGSSGAIGEKSIFSKPNV